MDKRQSGFEPIPPSTFTAPCPHPQHNPPTHLYIPPGQQYRHVCPGCGAEAILRNMNVVCGTLSIGGATQPEANWFFGLFKR